MASRAVGHRPPGVHRTASARRWLAAASVAVTALALPATTGAAPAPAAGGCLMPTSVTQLSHRVVGNGSVVDVFRATVRGGSGWGQTGYVKRVTLPSGVVPRLVRSTYGMRDLTSSMARRQQPRSLLAVNADYFDYWWVNGRWVVLPRGYVVVDGRVSRASVKRVIVLGVDVLGRRYVGQLGVGGTVRAGTLTFPVRGVNWQSLSAGPVVYTASWSQSPEAPRPAGAVEWVVVGGRIAAVRTHGTGAPVAAGSYVVAFPWAQASSAARAHVGDAVGLTLRQSTDTGVALRLAVGRGGVLVRGGAVVPPCPRDPPVGRPRTTVGWNAAGRWVVVTVPGTGYDWRGVRMGGFGIPQEANVVRALGVRNAVPMDGGNSTTLWLHRVDGSWQRLDDHTGTYERPVVNALTFVRP